MRVKQPVLAVISALLLIGVSVFVAERLAFLADAERVAGSVLEVSSSNSRCGGGRRRRSYSCTKFNAIIGFTTKRGEGAQLSLSAGSARGHNISNSAARFKRYQRVPIVYDPKHPTKAYEDTLWGVWGIPIMMFFAQIVTFISSFFETKRRHY